jgi:hypothetical protein
MTESLTGRLMYWLMTDRQTDRPTNQTDTKAINSLYEAAPYWETGSSDDNHEISPLLIATKSSTPRTNEPTTSCYPKVNDVKTPSISISFFLILFPHLSLIIPWNPFTNLFTADNHDKNCNHQHSNPTVCACFSILNDSPNHSVNLPQRSPASQETAIRPLTTFSSFKETEISFTPLKSLPKNVAIMTK